MIKKLLPIFILLFILTSTKSLADEGYVSPESYAVNEADLTDYIDVPPPTRPNIDNLDKPVKIKNRKREKLGKKNLNHINADLFIIWRNGGQMQEENQTPSEE